MEEIEIGFTVNGEKKRLRVPPELTLVEILRDRLFLTGAKEGCGHGDCGACIVLVDGKAMNSCLMLAGQVEGKNITTIEGLAQNGELSELQKAFHEEGGAQCGYCSPGMILSAKALLDSGEKLDDESIREALSGVICRCGTYPRVIKAVQKVAKNRGEDS